MLERLEMKILSTLLVTFCCSAVFQPAQAQMPPVGQGQPALSSQSATSGASSNSDTQSDHDDQVVKQYLNDKLSDPYSAHIDKAGAGHFGSIRPDVYTNWQGNVICYRVNAKNSYGAYTGAQYWIFVIDGDHVVGTLNSQHDNDLVREQSFKNECSGYGD